MGIAISLRAQNHNAVVLVTHVSDRRPAPWHQPGGVRPNQMPTRAANATSARNPFTAIKVQGGMRDTSARGGGHAGIQMTPYCRAKTKGAEENKHATGGNDQPLRK